MMLAVTDIVGLAELPTTERGLRDWLKRLAVPVHSDGKRFIFSLLDLPEDVQLAYRLKLAEEAGLAFGEQDDAAHLALMEKPVGVQATAHARAKVLGIVHKARAVGLKWHQIAPQIKAASLGKVPSEQTVNRWFKRVEGIDPANWPPALAPDYKGRTARAPMSKEAWEFFELQIEASGRNGTKANFKRQWKATRTRAAKKCWDWPSYETAMRRWHEMDVARQRAKELGKDAAAKSLTPPLTRPVSDMFAMEQVEQDFRVFKVLCEWEDGYVGCPTVGFAVDRASSKIVGRAIARTESEEAVVALNADMVDTHGNPDRVVIDNGTAFNGFRMMGGLSPLIRRKDKGEPNPHWALGGVYAFLGIKVINHGPEMPWVKLPESINSAMRHMDNDPEFFRAQRAGPNDAPNPDPVPVPIALFRAKLDEAINDLNADCESRAMGLSKGESRNAAFQRLLAKREAVTWPTPLQRRWMRLKWKLAKVSDAGQISIKEFTWGDMSTQKRLLDFAGEYVAIGFDPENPRADAMVYEWDEAAKGGRLILERVPAFEDGRHNDTASKHRATALRRAAAAAVEEHVNPSLQAHVDMLRSELMARAGDESERIAPAPIVQKLQTNGPFKPGLARGKKDDSETQEEIDRLLALLRPPVQEERVISGGNR